MRRPVAVDGADDPGAAEALGEAVRVDALPAAGELVDRRQALELQLDGELLDGERRRRVGRLGGPHAERRARLDDPAEGERRAGWRQPLERRQHGVAERAAVAIGDAGVSDVLMARSKLARRPLEEGRQGAVRGRLDHLPGGTDEVGRDERVLPRERRRVAGVVVEHAEHPPARRGDPADEQGVVCRRRGVEADDVAAGVQQVAVRGQRAAAGRTGERRRLGALDRLACSRRGSRPHRSEIRGTGGVAVRDR